MHKFTEEEKAYLREIVPGRNRKEIAEIFTKKFGWEITIAQVKGACARYHLQTGMSGRFEKGHVPHNKGVKGKYYNGCEKGWYKKGNIPFNHRPIGTEITRSDGYVWVKIAEPDVCKEKHRYIWEQEYGEIPEGSVLIFKDNNPQNCTLDNLLLISRRAHVVLNSSGMNKCIGRDKEAAVLIAYNKIALTDAKKKYKARKKNR